MTLRLVMKLVFAVNINDRIRNEGEMAFFYNQFPVT